MNFSLIFQQTGLQFIFKHQNLKLEFFINKVFGFSKNIMKKEGLFLKNKFITKTQKNLNQLA